MSDSTERNDGQSFQPVPTAYRVMDPDVPFHRSWMVNSGPTAQLWQHFAEMSGDAFKVAAFIACRTSATAGAMDGIVRGVLLTDAEAHTGLDEHRLLGAVAELESRGLIEVWMDVPRDEIAISLATARREAIAWIVRARHEATREARSSRPQKKKMAQDKRQVNPLTPSSRKQRLAPSAPVAASVISP